MGQGLGIWAGSVMLLVEWLHLLAQFVAMRESWEVNKWDILRDAQGKGENSYV